MKKVDPRFLPVLALVPPFVALGLQLALWSVIAPFSWFLFFPAVFISSWIGGLRPGLVATAISATVAWYFFVVPRYVLIKGQTNTLLTLTVFVLMGVLFSVFQERLRRATRSAAAALRESQLSNAALVESNRRVGDLLERTRQLDAVKTEFFANVSHELRTPLTLVLLPLERLITEMAPDDPHRSELQSARRNAQLLVAHVNNLLDAAKLDVDGVRLHYAAVDLARLARMTGAFYETRARDRDIDLVVRTPDALLVEVDPAQLRRVLMNLLGNAFTFTPDGGAIRVEVAGDGDSVTLSVADSGPGVPDDERDLIFERFRQGSSRADLTIAGTGLGLSIVRELVALHGGAVEVGSAPEGGALFTVTIPAAAPPGTVVGTEDALPWDDVQPAPESWAALPRTSVAAQEPLAAGRPVVLVVEDNPDLNELTAISLRGRYEVISAYNGQEGYDLARVHRPTVIVTDVMMPVLGGEELVDLVRADPDLATTPILVLSARADEAGRLNLLAAGADDYLVKPFDIRDLQRRIARLEAAARPATPDETTEAAGPVRVLIADDTEDLRDTLRAVLETMTDVDVVAEAGDGRQAVAQVVAHQPDLVLLDLSMPVLSGMDALAEIRVAAPRTKVVVLSGHGRDQVALDALGAGAVAYLEKGASTRRMVALISDLFPGRVQVRGTYRAATEPVGRS